MVRGDRSERRKIRGTAESVVVARHKLSRAPNGQANPVVAPSQDAIRESIESGICPWCGRGPYKMLAGHVNGQHGIDRFELRELAGLTRHVSICDPAYSDERRDLAQRQDRKPPPAKPGRQVTLSSAGREQLRANAQATQAKIKGTEAAQRGGRAGGRVRGAQLRKERPPCAVCGSSIPTVSSGKGRTRPGQKTCSDQCLSQLRSAIVSQVRGGLEQCTHGHPFTAENTYVRPNGSRTCKTCRRATQRKT